MPEAYYNEHDPFAAAWLRNLIMLDLIMPGDVDERSIEDVSPDDLRGFTQHHFFAGIGVWSASLRGAGWPDDRPVWTGSCPCQPFSAAGKGAGFADERHLWPAWFWLLRQHGPGVVLGEQVAAPAGLEWFDLVSTDLEDAGYAVAAADLCAAGVGAPHIRQRLWFVAHHHQKRQLEYTQRYGQTIHRSGGQASHRNDVGRCGRIGPVVDAAGEQTGLPGRTRIAGGSGERLANTAEKRRQGAGAQRKPFDREDASASGRSAAWAQADWLPCRDGKWRPVEPGTFPLAHGATARVGRLRGYGNAIVKPLAEEFIQAVMTCMP